jgi:hypothetical protein
MTFKCEYCERTFQREQSLVVHVCEQAQRRRNQNNRDVQLGYQAFLRFYESAHGSSRLKTYEDFCRSPYYRAFVQFGKYCIDIHALDPEQFLNWLLKHNKRIDRWCSDKLYTEFLIEYLPTENPGVALTRAIEYSIEWAERNEAAAHDCLRFGNVNAICYAVTTGRISPWVIYNCESGQRLLDNLTGTELASIWSYLDSDVWQRRFAAYPADQLWVKEMLTQAGW